ncbi:MAG: DUF2254 domain-containing protein [Acidobacteriota bacterium]
MQVRLSNLWYRMRGSYWFVPALLVVMAVALAFVTTALSAGLRWQAWGPLQWIYSGGPEGARTIFSTIAASMITVAGVVFSITIVALTLASSQFGPRLLVNFMRDTTNQVVLGIFIATFIYCLLAMRTVRSIPEHSFVPYLSVAFALALALVNVGVLIFFIHHVSNSIRAENVIAAVSEDLNQAVERLIRKRSDEAEPPAGAPARPENFEEQSCLMNAAKSGYLQAIDVDTLVHRATEHDLILHVKTRPGDFVVEGSCLLSAWPSERLTEEIYNSLTSPFILGGERTSEQDIEFSIHQLVEVALRALSPGINDPHTAMNCIDWLGASLCRLADKYDPSPYRYGEQGRLRVILTPVTFAGLTNAAFDQIRQYGRTSVAVTLRLLETITTVTEHTRQPEMCQALRRHALMCKEIADTEAFGNWDRKDLEDRFNAALQALEKKKETGTGPAPQLQKNAEVKPV